MFALATLDTVACLAAVFGVDVVVVIVGVPIVEMALGVEAGK